ncbi:hypothetical protein [Saccharothrix luteola]|uniref:hypothetical protein n=1 Tax=Saccharothrix luteola TaxID=2893018 RepID=UPI001E61D87E|nr:hypothetical protein [Saccharothrix luteola]MCC8250819.1 hypothetical protein [Saccharothrix luteola]
MGASTWTRSHRYEQKSRSWPLQVEPVATFERIVNRDSGEFLDAAMSGGAARLDSWLWP